MRDAVISQDPVNFGGGCVKTLVEIMAKALVDHPEQVSVTTIEGDGELTLELRVAPQDMGKVIGRQGRIAKAMRAVLKAAATKERCHVNLEIVE